MMIRIIIIINLLHIIIINGAMNSTTLNNAGGT